MLDVVTCSVCVCVSTRTHMMHIPVSSFILLYCPAVWQAKICFSAPKQNSHRLLTLDPDTPSRLCYTGVWMWMDGWLVVVVRKARLAAMSLLRRWFLNFLQVLESEIHEVANVLFICCFSGIDSKNTLFLGTWIQDISERGSLHPNLLNHTSGELTHMFYRCVSVLLNLSVPHFVFFLLAGCV